MKFTFNIHNILLFPDYNNKKDIQFIKQIGAYKFKDYYSIPVSKTSLVNLKQTYNEINSNNDFVKLFMNVCFWNSYNYFQTKSNNELLRDYQYQGVEWIKLRLNTSNALGLFWEPRTGKTRTTTIATKDYNKIVCLCLAGQELNWETNYKDFSNKKVLSLHKQSPKKRIETYNEFSNSQNCVLVGSMNTVCNDILTNPHIIKSYDLLVVDEIHKAKNFTTKLNQGIRILFRNAIKILGLTGTPVSKNQSEILNLISLLFPQVFSKSYLGEYFFTKEWNDFSSYPQYVDIKKEKEIEWLEFLNLYFSKIDKSVALPWINEPEIETIKLEMKGKQLKLYENCLYDFEVPFFDTTYNKWDTKQIQEIIAQFTYLRQITTSPKLLGVDIDSVKEQWLLEFLSNYIGDGVIIFSSHTSYLKMLSQTLSKYEPLLIAGETLNKTQIANEFQMSGKKIILGNIQAASKGITLDKADTIIFLDIDWKPDENKQAIERFSATTPQKEKFRKVIYLQISNEFEFNTQTIYSIDKYMSLVNDKKLTQTELINNFKDIYENYKNF